MRRRALVDQLRALPEPQLKAALASLTNREKAALAYAWREFWARPDQLSPVGKWVYWLLLGGRGAGKTMAGANWVVEEARRWGAAVTFYLVGRSEEAVRQTMVEGVAGILVNCPPDFTPDWTTSIGGGELTFPNGAKAYGFSADNPQALRGPECNRMWLDDVAAWGPTGKEAWTMAGYGFRRLGAGGPKCVLTSSPDKEELLRGLVKSERRGMVITRSITDDNRTNVTDEFFELVISEFAGTALERVERYGEDPEESEGALWKRAWIQEAKDLPELVKVVVAVDPAMTEEAWSDETGIVVLGLGTDDAVYVLADLTGKHSVETWPDLVVEAFSDYEADSIVCETNAGRNLVKRLLAVSAPNLPLAFVDARRGKTTRAEPVAALYRAGRVFHRVAAPGVNSPLHRDKKHGKAQTLVSELCGWVPARRWSPNGIDALCWGVWYLKPPNAWGAKRPVVDAPKEDGRLRFTSQRSEVVELPVSPPAYPMW